jgi:hypothetical protein
VPLTSAFDIADLKPECLHAVIKSVALLADLGETLGLLLPEPIELSAELEKAGLHKPMSGMKSEMFTLTCKTVEWLWATPVPLAMQRLTPFDIAFRLGWAQSCSSTGKEIAWTKIKQDGDQ